MVAIKGTVKNRHVVLDEPDGLAEGTRVEVVPVETAAPALGMREEDWPTTPEGIAAMLKRMDEFQPGWLSREDEAKWKAALREQREYDLSKWDERSRRIEGLFD